ncbi:MULTISPECIES: hypothetical protein [unclassified Bradyrhizobium]|uniref:hypothetical protein n=1 Tax=unclassified Bradyrhizobium TaxID=2631580 RepID=UPI00291618FE|nr:MULTISPECIES: hypothetical protein [unclassified Bradyrhizobium]
MSFETIVDDYIREYRPRARGELAEFRKLRSLKDAIHHASLCHWLPSELRHPHQYRIPAAALLMAESKLQRVRNRLARAKTFEALHDEVEHQILSIRKIGPLAVYDIAHRIGAYRGLTPAIVYLHRGTREGARALGFAGKTLDPRLLPKAFSRLKPYEIEDCLCTYKNALRGAKPALRHGGASICIPPSPHPRPHC